MDFFEWLNILSDASKKDDIYDEESIEVDKESDLVKSQNYDELNEKIDDTLLEKENNSGDDE